MKKIILVLVLSLSSSSAFAMVKENGKPNFILGIGQSMPSGGVWGNQYESSWNVSISAEIQKSEEKALGLELGYDAGHEHIHIKECKPRIFYVSPHFKETKNFGALDLYASIGIGLYHRWTPAYTDGDNGFKYAGGFSGKLGGNFGFGALYNLGNNLSASFALKIHYIRNFIGVNGTMVPATNMTPTFLIHKGF